MQWIDSKLQSEDDDISGNLKVEPWLSLTGDVEFRILPPVTLGKGFLK